MTPNRIINWSAAALICWLCWPRTAEAAPVWPVVTRQQKPWTYWWWMGSAVDTNNLARALGRFQKAGLGGVHIIPIYGARGWESHYIDYLSPRWLEMLAFTVDEAARLDMGVDMTTGTGWCLGGPSVTADEANAVPVVKQMKVASGGTLQTNFNREALQALMAFDAAGNKVDLLAKLDAAGSIRWVPDGGPWRVYALSQKPSGQKVKRAAPGGQGWMLNPFYLPAMTDYLRWFGAAFQDYSGPKPRAQFQDSYEYRSSWSPDLLAQFARRRGYRLQDELPALFGDGSDEHTGRVKCDYRETLSDLMAEESIPAWVQWCHQNGFLVRYQAHGAPGNLLDLYADADIPETEMFHLDRDKLFSKFASSAAHVAGHPLASSETGTWLKEHFTETLGDMKSLVDDFFLSGINHIFYHGDCYSPDEAGWPGWHFYASFEMNPRNPIWRDVGALNGYVARCQSLLQAGRPANDILLYWPVYDLWSDPEGMVRQFPVKAQDWMRGQPFGQTAQSLWERGFLFDYVSDRQLARAAVSAGKVNMPGASYRAVVVPECEHMPLATFSNLVRLAEGGATVIFDRRLPADVPGLARLDERRAAFKDLARQAGGRLRIGELESELASANISRETMSRHRGLACVRRRDEQGYIYFVANQSGEPIDDLEELTVPARAIALLDPRTGRAGMTEGAGNRFRLQLELGESVLLRAFSDGPPELPKWTYWNSAGPSVPVEGRWHLEFLEGGPELPASVDTNRLVSWAALPDPAAASFAGTARYTLRFDSPATNARWRLDLGKVCQSARVSLNGRDLGTLIAAPFRVALDDLRPVNNLLQIEVTSVAANRIRDLDRRKVKWKTFRDINVVNLDYKPFDASGWPLTDCGLLGPVTLTPLQQSSSHK